MTWNFPEAITIQLLKPKTKTIKNKYLKIYFNYINWNYI